MIELGELKSCVETASEAVFGPSTDRYTQIFAGRALLATADDALVSRYADLIKARAADLPGAMLWDAFERLFPKYISIDELLAILSAMDSQKRDENYAGIQIQWPTHR